MSVKFTVMDKEPMMCRWFIQNDGGSVAPTELGDYAVDTHGCAVGYDLTPLTGLGNRNQSNAALAESAASNIL